MDPLLLFPFSRGGRGGVYKIPFPTTLLGSVARYWLQARIPSIRSPLPIYIYQFRFICTYLKGICFISGARGASHKDTLPIYTHVKVLSCYCTCVAIQVRFNMLTIILVAGDKILAAYPDGMDRNHSSAKVLR